MYAYWQVCLTCGIYLASCTRRVQIIWVKINCLMLQLNQHKLLRRHFTAKLSMSSVSRPMNITSSFTFVMVWSSSNRYHYNHYDTFDTGELNLFLIVLLSLLMLLVVLYYEFASSSCAYWWIFYVFLMFSNVSFLCVHIFVCDCAVIAVICLFLLLHGKDEVFPTLLSFQDSEVHMAVPISFCTLDMNVVWGYDIGYGTTVDLIYVPSSAGSNCAYAWAKFTWIAGPYWDSLHVEGFGLVVGWNRLTA